MTALLRVVALLTIACALACGSDSSGETALTASGLSPTTGSTAGGTAVTLTGTGFAAGLTATFGGSAATGITVVSGTSATLTTPAHAAGAVDVVVTSGGTSVTLAGSFTYQAPVFAAPTLSAVSPAGGALAGGTALTLTGTGFRSGATVSLGGAAATSVVVVSDTSVTCVAPAHAAGVVDVTISNTDSKSATKAAAFEYAAAPTVTSVSPALGVATGGTALTLTGTGFKSGATVSLGGTAATAVAVASTSITCTTPAHAAGAVDVVVTNGDGQSGTKAASFTYVAVGPTTITSVIPGSGPTAGGTTLDVTGTGFTALTTAHLGTAAAAVTLVDATHLKITTAAGTGRVNVSVQNPGSSPSTQTGAFTFYAPASEIIVAANGTAHGGSALLVFDPNDSGDVPPNGDSIFAPASGDLTGLVAPARVLVRPNGLLYEINSFPQNDGAFNTYSWANGTTSTSLGTWTYGHRTGNAPPLQHLVNPGSGSPIFNQPAALGWDSKLGMAIVGNYIDGNLMWIADGASGTVAPTKVMQTKGGGLEEVIYDDRTDELYTLNGNSGTIDLYNEADSGAATSTRSIAFANYDSGTDYAVDMVLDGDELIVVFQHSIQVYPRTASGTVSPTRKISGDQIGFVSASGLAMDFAKNELYVSERGTQAGVYAGIYVFNRTDSGNVAPKRKIQGPNTDNADAIGVYVNHLPHDCASGPAVGAAQVALWFDAACGKSLKVTSGGVVSWADRASGYELASVGTAMRYDFDAGLSRPAILVDAAGNLASTSFPSAVFAPSSDLSIFTWFKQDQAGGALFAWDKNTSDSDPPHVRLHTPYDDGNLYFDSGTTNDGRISGPTTSFTGVWHNLVAQRSGGSAVAGTYPISTAANVIASGTGLTGSVPSGDDGTFSILNNTPGGMTELIVTKGAMSSADTDAIGAYLAAKWLAP
ncbi:MAG: IPT/TIG domain-containing protein [Deltaproteobacteria bacterium]|nr:IPT/TIG domain-containing protein [Deltaproteobacteria bacterium]